MILAACPGDAVLREYLIGRSSDADAERLETHLSSCGQCVQTLQTLAPDDDALLAAFQAQHRQRPPANPQVDALRSALRDLYRTRHSRADTSGGDSATSPPEAPPAGAEEFPEGMLAPAQLPDEVGRLGSYRVLGLLGVGGMGLVLKGEDPSLRRLVALKVMRPALAGNAQARERFLREARAMAALSHDNIVAVYQVGEDRGVPYLAMPLLQGEMLEERLRREHSLPTPEALRIGREMALGLASAHERGMVHRDIKPGNVWLEAPGGRVKILDFGLARAAGDGDPHLTSQGTILGTPAYMAPEQVNGSSDQRSDLFSLGCVLYRMTTGRLPFGGESLFEILRNVALREPDAPAEVNPEVSPEVSKFILRLLSKEPADRPVSAAVVARVLDTLSRRQAGAAPAPAPAAVPALPRPTEQPTAIPVALPVGATGPATADTVVLPVPGHKPFAARWSRRRVIAAAALLGLLGVLVLVAVIIPPGPDHDPSQPGGPGSGIDPSNRGFSWRGKREVPEALRIPVPPIETGKPMRPDSLVSRPARLDGIRSWDLLPNDAGTKIWKLVNVADDHLALGYATQGWIFWDYVEGKSVPAPNNGSFQAITPDRRMIAYTGNLPTRTVYLQETTPGKLPHPLHGHREPVNSVEFSSDGAYLATCDMYELYVWDVKSGQPLKKWTSPSSPVTFLDWSDDGRTICLAARGAARLFLIDTASGEMRKMLTLPGEATYAAWSPDGRRLAVVNSSDGKTYLVDEKSVVTVVGEDRCRTVPAWSPDGSLLAYGSGDIIVLYDVSGSEANRVGEFRGHGNSVNAVLFAPDGRTLVSAAEDGTVRFWNLETQEQRGTLVTGNYWVAVSPEGHYRGSATNEQLSCRFALPGGDVEVLRPVDFSKRFGWTNNPDHVRLVEFSDR